MALGRVVHAQVVANAAHDNVARVHSHSHREAQALGPLELVRVTRQLRQQIEGRMAGAQGVILMRNGGTEERHDPVPRELVDRSLVAMDAGPEDPKEAIHYRVPLLGIDLFRKIHRALDVGEERGDRLTLAFEGGTQGQDLLGQVLRCVVPQRAFR